MDATVELLRKAAERAEKEAQFHRQLLIYCSVSKRSGELSETLDEQLRNTAEIVSMNSAECVSMLQAKFDGGLLTRTPSRPFSISTTVLLTRQLTGFLFVSIGLRAAVDAREAELLAIIKVEETQKLESLRVESRLCRDNQQKAETFEKLVQEAAASLAVGDPQQDDTLAQIETMAAALQDVKVLVETNPEFPLDIDVEAAVAAVDKVPFLRHRQSPAKAAASLVATWQAEQQREITSGKKEEAEHRGLASPVALEIVRAKYDILAQSASSPKVQLAALCA